MDKVIQELIQLGLNYLKSTNLSKEAWDVIIRHAAPLGDNVKNQIISGIEKHLFNA